MKKLKNIPLGPPWGIFILILTMIPGSFIPEVPDFMSLFEPDKLVHIGIFAVFVFLMLRDFRMPPSPQVVKNHPVLFALNIAIFIGAMTEIIQIFIPGRSASPYDFIADAVGCLIGWGVYHRSFARKKS